MSEVGTREEEGPNECKHITHRAGKWEMIERAKRGRKTQEAAKEK